MFEEEPDDVDTDGIGHLEDSPRFVFINDECENLIVVNDCGEFTRNISQKKKSSVLHRLFHVDIHNVTNAVGESISSVTMWNIVNQLGKQQFLVGQ